MANTKDLIDRLAEETGLFNYQIKLVLTTYRKLIIDGLLKGEAVPFPKLGKFWLKYAAPQKGWDPAAMTKKDLPARYIPKFLMGKIAYEFIRKNALPGNQGEGGKSSS